MIADVQFGANAVARGVSALSADAVKQLEQDIKIMTTPHLAKNKQHSAKSL